MLGPLRSLEEQRHEQQLHEIDLRRQERERRAAEEDGGARDDGPPIQEKADELTGPFHYDFSHWARSEARHEPHQRSSSLAVKAVFRRIADPKRRSFMTVLCLYVCRAGEKITVTPSSKELLFYPPEVEATITGGQFLHGCDGTS